MRIKRVELKDFKRFTHLIVEGIPETAKLVILVGPNGSGKTSFMEAMNHYYKYSGYGEIGDYHYLSKVGNVHQFDGNEWYTQSARMVDIDFYDQDFPKNVGQSKIKSHFYFRSAYRNEPDFQISVMEKQNNPTESIRLSSLIQNDQTVSSNYQRLVASTISDIYDGKNDTKTVASLREELTGQIREAVIHVFEDLDFSTLGNPLANGSFYFTKGTTKDFDYRNLSAGEKSAFDLLLDMIVQSKYYPDAVYCIDEPEIHMHTKLQGRLLQEMFALIPGKSQLWISTHSIGMLQEAEELENEHPGTVIFLDFGDRDFDTDQIIRPAKIGRAVMDKFYELAFGDFAKLMLPETIVFCEGNSNGNSRKNFDKTIYSTVFGDTHPKATFISGGSSNEIENIEKSSGEIIRMLLDRVKNIIKIIDRDDRSEQEVMELNEKGIKALTRRNLECYLLDDTVIKKLCENVGKVEVYEKCLEEKTTAINASVERGNPSDDLKKASGDIYLALKKLLQLTQCGNNADTFMRDTLAPLITPDMDVYKQLEADIFGEAKAEANSWTK